MARMDGVLVVLGGLPGVGKTTVARALAAATGAVHIRIDSIEQALRETGVAVEDQGYRAAYALAEDNLRLGQMVIADCVNPWPLTRHAWRDVAARAGARALEVEIVCSDPAEHRRRLEARVADIPNHRLPSWKDVQERDYRAWEGARLVIDTCGVDANTAARAILSALKPADR